MSDTVLRITFDHLRLSVTPTQFATFNGVTDPVSGRYEVENVRGFPFAHRDFLGTKGDFNVANGHDVSITVKRVFGFHTDFTFDLHDGGARRFIHKVEFAFHHQG